MRPGEIASRTSWSRISAEVPGREPSVPPATARPGRRAVRSNLGSRCADVGRDLDENRPGLSGGGYGKGPPHRPRNPLRPFHAYGPLRDRSRDADRIVAATKLAGVTKIDFVLLTHYHADHAGGVTQLLERIPVGTFIDHGPNLENAEQTNTGYANYQAVLAKTGARHVVAKPGDKIPIAGLDVVVLTAAGEHINRTLPGGGQNTNCGADPPPPDDPTENAASLGILVTYGKFRFLDLGDLTKKKELALMCPNNPIGRVDVFLVSHHGLDQSNSKGLVDGVRPRVAITNNGPHKGGSPEAWQTVHQSQGLEDLWQLHYAMGSDKAHNSPDNVIANLNDSDGNYLKLVAQADGSFTITNSRNNYQKSYAPLLRNPVDFSRLPAPQNFDYSLAAIDTVTRPFSNPADFGPWAYQRGLFLYGEYLVYQRTGDRKYLDFIKGWVDPFLDDQGNLKHGLDNLDSMEAGNLFIVLYRETKDERYHHAAQQIRDRLKDSYPRTHEGAFWHGTTRQWQTWLDGIYMSMPLLVRYGELFNDSQYANDEATKQFIVYAKNVGESPTGLLYHAYDESGQQPWADPVKHHSSQFWCRAIGWYGMALVDVLEMLPKDHPQRPQLIALVQRLAKAYARFQDPETGLWFEVVDRADVPDNWLETSSSSMYTYMLARAVERGYIGKEYEKVAEKGYRGVLASITRNADGTISIPNICEGTNVGDLAFYLARARRTNDLHGMGAFIIMNEQMRKTAGNGAVGAN